MKTVILAFRIGRKYNGQKSQGTRQFLGEAEISEFMDEYNLHLNEEEGEYYDEGGNSVELTPAEVESGIGTINYDGQYDTVYTKSVSYDENGVMDLELTAEEHNAIFWSEDYSHDDIKEKLKITERY